MIYLLKGLTDKIKNLKTIYYYFPDVKFTYTAGGTSVVGTGQATSEVNPSDKATLTTIASKLNTFI